MLCLAGHKARSMGHPGRIKLTNNNGLLTWLGNPYTMRGTPGRLTSVKKIRLRTRLGNSIKIILVFQYLTTLFKVVPITDNKIIER